MYPTLNLLPGKEANLGFKHPWIFSGALIDLPKEVQPGDLVRVADKHGKILGTGTFSNKSSIAVRVFAFGDAIIDRAWIADRLKDAQAKREQLGFGPGTETTGYRLVFGESDNLPGLVVDRYDDVFVYQISTAGMEKLKHDLLAALIEVFTPRAVVERSDMPARREEGLENVTETVHGENPGLVEFKENGMTFIADVIAGQKTGFFLDQKDLRQAIGKFCKDRKVLNIFSYTGAAGIAALKGGATSVHNVDSSGPALARSAAMAELNDIDAASFTIEEKDAFQFLGEHNVPEYDVVMMDPPALIKARRDEEEGKKAYHFLNRAGMRMVKDGGIFITSSCSHYMSEEDLAFTLRRASVQSNITLSVLGTVRQSADHPLSVYFPESAYLKTFICQVKRN